MDFAYEFKDAINPFFPVLVTSEATEPVPEYYILISSACFAHISLNAWMKEITGPLELSKSIASRGSLPNTLDKSTPMLRICKLSASIATLDCTTLVLSMQSRQFVRITPF